MDVHTLWPFSRGRSCGGNVLSCGQAPIQFPAAEKGTLALLYKGRFPLLQRTRRCSRCGVSLYLQIGVLGLNASFLRLLECGLRLGVASDCALCLERISRFPPMKTVPWRQNTVISWLCRSLRIMTARMPVWTCIWVVCRTFLSLPKQTLGQLLCPFDATHLGVAQLVTAEVIPLAVLGNIPQLAPQALCTVIQPLRINFFGADLTRSFKVYCTWGLSKTMAESYYQNHQGTKDKASNTTN